LAAGLAWHYVKYSNDTNLATLQQQARADNLGLWQDAKRIAPWDWRNGQRIPTALPAELESIRDSDETVWITPSGEKYHRRDCRFVGDGAIEMPLSRATAYEPCQVCKP
jgi:hypothetical protein